MKLCFDKVSAAYRRNLILKDVSFGVPKGSLTVLVGLNGAGKSTLLRCLTGEKHDYQGRILLDGQDIRHFSPVQRALQLSCLVQTLPQPHVTVRELVSFGRTPYIPFTGRLNRADAEAVERALEAAGMSRFSSAWVDDLSGGERRKAFFAMTLAQDTPLMVLDEPTAHLDAASRLEFLELVQRQKQSGKTFLAVMHDLPDVLRHADHIAVLHEGRIVFEGTPEACLEAQIPQRCFSIQLSGDAQSGYAVQKRIG